MALLNRRGRALLFAAAIAAIAAIAAGCSNKVTTPETTGGAAPANNAASTDAPVKKTSRHITLKSRRINYDTLTDKRDGKAYRTITVGGKTWMAENLNYESPNGRSSCLNNDPDNCEKFGRLYDKKAAQEACPAGWLLPLYDDWVTLAANVSGIRRLSPLVGKKMRAASGWEKSGLVRGTDDKGFAALPGGSEPPPFKNNAVLCAWWMIPPNVIYGYNVIALYKDTLTRFADGNKDRYSVRCVMDDGSPLAITAGDGGTVSIHPNKSVFMTGDTVTITAVPNSGYAFARWNGDAVANTDSAVTTIIVRRDNTEAAAVFRATPGAAGAFSDKRDGKTYKTTQIGGQVWMAQNLNYKTGGSHCYNDSLPYCNKYGRLYDWNTAKTACPAGWHLPSNKEWAILAKASGDDNTVAASIGNALKADEGWNPYYEYYEGRYGYDEESDGTDDYGFAALPGGGRAAGNPGGGSPFHDIGDIGAWWTATESARNNGNAQFRALYNHSSALLVHDIDKGYGLSVRCVMDGGNKTEAAK